jgi:hypothetical protein
MTSREIDEGWASSTSSYACLVWSEVAQRVS